jgi:DNA gyrase subunit A
VTDADQVLLITQSGMLIRIKVKDIRETGRAAQGVRLIYLEEGDRVVAVAKLAETDEGEDEPQATLPVAPPAAGGDSKAQGPKSNVKEPEAPFLDEE